MSDSEDLPDPMLEAMGFTSFGAPAAKKRKLHDNTFIDAPQLQTQAQRHGTNANATALGERKPRAAPQDTPVAESATVGIGDVNTTTIGQDGDSAKATTNDPKNGRQGKTSKPKAKDLHAGGLAAFLSHGQSLPARPGESTPPRNAVGEPAGKVQAGGEGQGKWTGDAEGVKARPVDMAAYSLQDLRYGVRNEHGDVAYFLPSFLEDPWVGLR
ncbi:hypothetical protein BDZ85DRAFT_63885 [Elsinoe ampelina]|uniref:Uncharacterized protein n=1 Tax=Elsinoe ampelina TaxID=302913 RepID=A0A6A6FZ89_9PEZI|nr:hypothetical protein BDZ85DRAFT_63885 [Elsinoe ampelina]